MGAAMSHETSRWCRTKTVLGSATPAHLELRLLARHAIPKELVLPQALLQSAGA